MSTLKEIAQKAGVSSALISAYLNGRSSARMGLETKARIDSALRETGYSPNPLARALRTGKSGIIGYVASSLQNNVSQQELVCFHETLESHGYRMMTQYTKDEYLLLLKGCQELIYMGCDGLIINSIIHKEALEYCRTLPVPVIGVCREPLWNEYDFMISVDYRSGVKNALNHLIQSGRRHIVFLSHQWGNLEEDPRFLIFREFFSAEQCEIYPQEKRLDLSWLRDILKRHPECDGFFCIDDNCAITVWGILNELGFRIPQDFVLIGFDDLPAASGLRLASIRKPQKELAENAVMLLESRLKKKTLQVNRKFFTEFIPRHSCINL